MLERRKRKAVIIFFFGASRISSLGPVDDAREDRRAKIDRPGRDSESLEKFYRELRENLQSFFFYFYRE